MRGLCDRVVSRMGRPTRRHRNERGAVAVTVALLSVVLLAVSAMTVDLGNAWARKRSVQKQVDVAALYAGNLLPVTTTTERTAIAQAVADSMNDTSNRVAGQPLATASGLLSTDVTDGRITFMDDTGAECYAGSRCTRMTVVAPVATVDFGLAGVIGVTEANVTRSATVGVFSQVPDGSDTLPFWLPSGCSFGPAEGDTTQDGNGNGNGNGLTGGSLLLRSTAAPAAVEPAPAVSAAPGAVQTQSAVSVSPVGSHTISGTNYNVLYGSTTSVTTFTVNNVPSNTDRASLRFISPDGSTYVDFAVAEENPRGTLIVPTFQVGSAVSNTPGGWQVYALIKPQGNQEVEYSSNYLTFTVGPNPSAPTSSVTTSVPTTSVPTTSTPPTGTETTDETTTTATASPTSSPTGIPVGCVGQDRGNFGQLQSPRDDVGAVQQALSYNIAAGLDHELEPYVFPTNMTEVTSCETGPHSLIPSASPDDVSENGRNCIFGDTGNDGPMIYDGMITGTNNPNFPGRLDSRVAGRETTCSGRTSVDINGVPVNNDVLSCFLRGGATLADISQPTGVSQAMLDPAVVDSPRFVWMPVVYANHRAEHESQPIRLFVPAFITDETGAASNGNSDATSDNGLTINGHSVSTLRVYTFNAAVLPDNEQSPHIMYDENVGRKVVQLLG